LRTTASRLGDGHRLNVLEEGFTRGPALRLEIVGQLPELRQFCPEGREFFGGIQPCWSNKAVTEYVRRVGGVLLATPIDRCEIGVTLIR
jgi:hypothetical protein